jgi:L,D-transpeptidase YcbB
MKNFRKIALAAACLTLILQAGCASLFYKAEAKKEVEKLNLDLSYLLRAKAESDPAPRSEIQAGFEKRFAEAVKLEKLLGVIHDSAGKAQFRFVTEHGVKSDHFKLIATLKSSFDEGLDAALFHPHELFAQGESITQIAEKLDQAQNVVLSEQQKAKLIEDLVKAEKAEKAPGLSGGEIIEWMLAPNRAEDYSEIHEAYAQLTDLVVKRGKVLYNTEIDDSIAFFKYLRAMGVSEEMLTSIRQASIGDFEGAMKQALPNNPHYLRLRSELARYRKLTGKNLELPKMKVGKKSKIKKSKNIEKAKKLQIVEDVQIRLEIEGYYSGEVNGIFDDLSEEALIEYQRTHQVVSDGVIGRGTINAMNISFSERVDQIILSMARQRRSATRYEEYYLRVNIPEFVVEVIEDGKILRRHKIVVGRPSAKNQTPELQAKIEKIVYNPSWYIPKRIFEEEQLPKWEEDEEYFKNKGYVTVNDEEGVPKRAYQPPGYGNALGRVKILFPNTQEVYLHDTPSKYLFSRTSRPFSHGCMRLQNPLEMAEFLLQKDNNPEVENIEKILEKTWTKEIVLQKTISVFVEYNTVSTTDDGRAVFLADVYKRDADALSQFDGLAFFKEE